MIVAAWMGQFSALPIPGAELVRASLLRPDRAKRHDQKLQATNQERFEARDQTRKATPTAASTAVATSQLPISGMCR